MQRAVSTGCSFSLLKLLPQQAARGSLPEMLRETELSLMGMQGLNENKASRQYRL